MAEKIQMISTRHEAPACSFADAMKKGLAEDEGLFMPDPVPVLSADFWNGIQNMNLQEIGQTIAACYVETESEKSLIRDAVKSAITFDAPLIHLRENLYLLELFHGPTLAFKDFGARFMARAFSGLDTGDDERDLLILVATSGDTGSAVAHGFHGVQGTQVCLLYPSGKVSALQEQQMTTLGGNVTALKVEGTFDDCQRLVKQAFSDRELGKVLRMSSANSINIARLLPQSFYYVYAYAKLRESHGNRVKPVFSVPSGNFGNLTAGLLAMKMGMPVSRFLAATNLNDVIPEFLQTGAFRPRPSVETISNAMDVGDPSNFERILYLFNHSHAEVLKHIRGFTFNDDETREYIRRIYQDTGYILDPHTAVGLQAAGQYREEEESDPNEPIITLSTAHPSKFGDIVENEISKPVQVPLRLKACMKKEKKSITIDREYESFRKLLLEKWLLTGENHSGSDGV